jgi:Nuclease-related domain
VAVSRASSTAGRFAEERFRARRRAWWRRVWWIFPTLAALEVAVCVGIGALVQPEHVPFYWGFGLGIAVTMVMTFADSPPNHIERWRQGFQGEKATAKVLRRFVAKGWVLINDIDTGRGNIDHILVGPPGVFLLESKNLHGLLTVERGVLSVRWREDPDDGYKNDRLTPRMDRLRHNLEAQLERDSAAGIQVQPVVVLWGNFEQRSIRSKGYVVWVRGNELADMLDRRPSQLSTDDVRRVASILT